MGGPKGANPDGFLALIIIVGFAMYMLNGNGGMNQINHSINNMFGSDQQVIRVTKPRAPEPTFITTKVDVKAYNGYVKGSKHIAMIPKNTKLNILAVVNKPDTREIAWIRVSANGINVWIPNKETDLDIIMQ
jgi:hypothetical protein